MNLNFIFFYLLIFFSQIQFSLNFYDYVIGNLAEKKFRISCLSSNFKMKSSCEKLFDNEFSSENTQNWFWSPIEPLKFPAFLQFQWNIITKIISVNIYSLDKHFDNFTVEFPSGYIQIYNDSSNSFSWRRLLITELVVSNKLTIKFPYQEADGEGEITIFGRIYYCFNISDCPLIAADGSHVRYTIGNETEKVNIASSFRGTVCKSSNFSDSRLKCYFALDELSQFTYHKNSPIVWGREWQTFTKIEGHWIKIFFDRIYEIEKFCLERRTETIRKIEISLKSIKMLFDWIWPSLELSHEYSTKIFDDVALITIKNVTENAKYGLQISSIKFYTNLPSIKKLNKVSNDCEKYKIIENLFDYNNKSSIFIDSSKNSLNLFYFQADSKIQKVIIYGKNKHENFYNEKSFCQKFHLYKTLLLNSKEFMKICIMNNESYGICEFFCQNQKSIHLKSIKFYIKFFHMKNPIFISDIFFQI